MGQWSGLSTFTAVALDSVSGQGTKIPQDIQRSQKKKMGQGQGEQQIYEWEKLGLKKKYCDNTGTFYYRNK